MLHATRCGNPQDARQRITKHFLNTRTFVIPILAFPCIALPNVTGTATLYSGDTLRLDTGQVVTSGGDILWTGNSITPQGKATAVNLGPSDGPTFAALTKSFLSGAIGYSNATIPPSSLAANDVFAVLTNGGNYAAVLVTQVLDGSIRLQFTTFVPAIAQVLNNYGLIPLGFPNSGIAVGALFIIKGSDLASATTVSALESSAPPGLPATLNGASVSVTVNGVETNPGFYYAIASQLALVMPSTTPTGAGTITVTYNGQTSSPFNITVTASTFGFASYFGNGSGLGIATNPDTGAFYNYSNSIPPGNLVSMWGTGLGADPTRDTTFSTSGLASGINNLAKIYVGGISATIQYQGASGYPGVNQVNIYIPANVATGCNVSVVGVTAAGVPTNFLTLPIGNGTCSDPAFGTSGSTISTLSANSTVVTGELILYQITAPYITATTSDYAAANFQTYTGAAYGATPGSVSIGGCVASEISGAISGLSPGLNPGTVTVTGPNGAATLIPSAPSLLAFSSTELSTGFIPASGGTFTFNGTGGTGSQGIIGPFNAPIVFPGLAFTWTNQSPAATITRSAGLPINWTGGSPGTYVVISGSSSLYGGLPGTGTPTSGSFTCTVPVSALQFTVPAYVLAGMPGATLLSNPGYLTVQNQTAAQTFTAPGIDYGYAIGYVMDQIYSAYQ